MKLNKDTLKYLQLGGIAIGVSGAVLAWQWFSNPASKKPEEKAAAPAPHVATAETPAPTPEEQAEPTPENTTEETMEQQLARIRSQTAANPYDAAYTPSKTGKELAATRAGNGNTPRNSSPSTGGGGGGSKKGGGGGASGGGGGGGSGGGGAGGAAPAPEAAAPTEETEASPESTTYWLQTGDDPRAETPNGARHNRTCVKFGNVPGQPATKAEGSACSICGG